MIVITMQNRKISDLINTYQIVSNRKLIFTHGSVLHLSYVFILHIYKTSRNGHVYGKSHDVYNSAIVFDLGLCNVFY